MSNKQFLYKYRYFDSKGFHLKIISEQEIYFASPKELNDPFDCKIPVRFDKSDRKNLILSAERKVKRENPNIHPNQLKKEAEKLAFAFLKDKNENQIRFENNHRNLVDRKVGICSFSMTKNHSSMWSLYSNLHRGFMVVFDFQLLRRFFEEFFLENSKTKGAPLVYGIDVKYEDETPTITLDLLDSGIKHFLNLFSIKSEDWKFENEFRFVSYNKTKIKFKVPKSSIVEVIAGVNISSEHFDVLSNLCSDTGILLRKATIEPKFFKPVY